jgi:hypothetical protein
MGLKGVKDRVQSGPDRRRRGKVRESRQGDEAEIGCAEALDKHERLIQRLIDEHEFALFLERWQSVRQPITASWV